MVFYVFRLTYKIKTNNTEETGDKVETESPILRRELVRKCRSEWAQLVFDINSHLGVECGLDGNISALIVGGRPEKFRVLAGCKLENVTLKECKTYIKKAIQEADGEIGQITFESEMEIGSYDIEDIVSRAKYGNLINESARFSKDLGINYFKNWSFHMSEMCMEGKITYKQAIKRANELMADDTLLEEIDRIYSMDNVKKYYGNPVHYKISVGNPDTAKDIYELLILALKSNKRLLGSRVEVLSNIKEYCEGDRDLYNIFSVAQGNCVVIDMAGDDSEHTNSASSYEQVVSYFNSLIEKFGMYTLCFFIEYSNKPGFSQSMISKVEDSIDIVEIKEGAGDYEKALALFKKLAKDSNFDATESDFNKLISRKKLYSISEVYNAYRNWYGDVLKSKVYKAYQTRNLVKNIDSKKTTDPYKELQDMVGLTEVKSVVDQIISAGKMRKLRIEMGIDTYKPSMHMVFKGNPGSAKTSVARLLAQILNKEGVLESGNYVEVGRADLIEKYVGWTAKAVCEKFREAQGGILFIDEAYSLVDDYSRSYGDEAINTIVMEMENHRDDVIVIFAGYPEKMDVFLDQNEGLRSRIAFHLDFPDYTEGEMWQIFKLMTEKRGYKLADDTELKCMEIFRDACTHKDFGNGRFVRNLLEQAEMCQAQRVLEENKGKKISKAKISELRACDFETNAGQKYKEKKQPMGFVV